MAVLKQLVAVVVLRRARSALVFVLRQRPDESPGGDDDALERVRLLTCARYAKAAGIDFMHQAPTLDPKLEHIMPIIASMGAAVSRRRFRPRRLAGPLRRQQRRGRARTASTATCATARSRTSPRRWASPT